MDYAALATIIVAAIAGVSALASQRAAARASTMNTQTTSRVDMEREAYERARAFDTETIARQDREIAELRAEILSLKATESSQHVEIMDLKSENKDLRKRIFRLESAGMPNNTAVIKPNKESETPQHE